MNLICLDIEATDNGEMLELSIIRHADSKIVYHNYFKPSVARSWPNSQAVHHISPEMVKDSPSIKQEKKAIQKIIDQADGIMGFAIDNDIKYLAESNISIGKETLILEVRDWFWYYKGRELGVEFGTVPSLSKCAQMLGFEFSEEEDAHSATNDTLMTIKLFDSIIAIADTGLPLKDKIKEFEGLYEEEKRIHAMEMAKGHISLVKTSKGYLIKNNHVHPASNAEVSIAVDSRYVAEHDIRDKFRKRETTPDSGLYNLRNSDIDFFKTYTNTYNPEKEEFYRHFLRARNKSKSPLPFHL